MNNRTQLLVISTMLILGATLALVALFLAMGG